MHKHMNLLSALFIVLFLFSCSGKEDNAKVPAGVSEPSAGFHYDFSGFGYKSYNITDIKDKITPVQLELFQKIREVPEGALILVIGHADARGPESPVGDKPGNGKWSELRAKSMVQYLSSQTGVDESVFRVIGKGSRDLKDKATPYSGRNRRVEILYDPPGS